MASPMRAPDRRRRARKAALERINEMKPLRGYTREERRAFAREVRQFGGTLIGRLGMLERVGGTI